MVLLGIVLCFLALTGRGRVQMVLLDFACGVEGGRLRVRVVVFVAAAALFLFLCFRRSPCACCTCLLY